MKFGKRILKQGIVKMLVLGIIASLGLTACKSTQIQVKENRETIIREKLVKIPSQKYDTTYILKYDTIYNDSIVFVRLIDTIFTFETEKYKSEIKITGNNLNNKVELKEQYIKTADTIIKEKKEIIKEKNKGKLIEKIIVYILFPLLIIIIIKKLWQKH